MARIVVGNFMAQINQNPAMKKSFISLVLLLSALVSYGQEKELLVENFDDESHAWSPRDDADFVLPVLLSNSGAHLPYWYVPSGLTKKK